MSKGLFLVTRTHGPRWQESQPLEAQQDWKGHASFMDALESEAFVVLAGPVEGAQEALLVVRAESAEEIERRLADDPWTGLDLLRTTRIARWTLRIGSV